VFFCITTLSKEQRLTIHQPALGGALVVTLKQVAARAGVSIKTVSRIVNDDAAVNAKTREQVQRHLQSLNYIPNNAARQMRSGASTTFGLMTDVVATTPYSVDIVRGAQAALQDAQQTLLIASSDGDPEREAQLWRMFRAHRVAGVVYASMFHRAHDVGQPAFDKSIVLANCFAGDGKRASIIPDDELGGYTQAQYLLKAGHRRIGIITLIPDIEATRLRALGMRRAFAEAGVGFDEGLEQRGMKGIVGGEVMVTHGVARDMLMERNRPTAIICGNDQIAMQVYSAAASLGLSIPEHLSVIGFDDLKLISETLYPQLTTVALPYFEIGRRAVEVINRSDTGTSQSLQKQLVPCPLIERNSCKPLA
jgi:LacI family transcriptional regulator